MYSPEHEHVRVEAMTISFKNDWGAPATITMTGAITSRGAWNLAHADRFASGTWSDLQKQTNHVEDASIYTSIYMDFT